MQVNKEKLIAALKARRERIIKNHAKRISGQNCNRHLGCKPPISAIDKELIELQLADESVLTVEFSHNALNILLGDEDGNEREYDDDEDEDDEE